MRFTLTGIVIELHDRGPYRDEPDTFGLEFPVIEYVDEHGVTRKQPIWKGAFSGYFHVGQEVAMARTRSGYEIADRWFIWQNTLAYIAFATLLTVVAVGYHVIRGKFKESNQPDEPTPVSAPR